MKKTAHNRGVIKTVLLVLFGILFLGFIGVDLEEALKRPVVVKNFQFVWNATKTAWIEYVYTPLSNIGNKDSDPINDALQAIPEE